MKVYLKKNAWYSKLQRIVFPRDELSKNLCPFFWKTILSILVFPFHLVGFLLGSIFMKFMTGLDDFIQDNNIEPWVNNPNLEQFQYMLYVLKRKSIDLSPAKNNAYLKSTNFHFDKFHTEVCPKASKYSFETDMLIHGHALHDSPKYRTYTTFRLFIKLISFIFLSLYILFSAFILAAGITDALAIFTYILIGWISLFLLGAAIIWIPYYQGVKKAKAANLADKTIYSILTIQDWVTDGFKLLWFYIAAVTRKICPIIEWED